MEKYKSKALLQAFTTTEVISSAGNAGEEILRAAERQREKMDTIVMGSRGGLAHLQNCYLEADHIMYFSQSSINPLLDFPLFDSRHWTQLAIAF